MNRRVFLKSAAGGATLLGISATLAGCHKDYYTAADFMEAPKTDVHFHYNTLDDTCLKYANSLGMQIVTINVDAGESINEQLDTAVSLQKQHPRKISFLGTFSVESFGTDDFADQTIARIDRCMNLGAKGIKIWKNIGMSLQDELGNYVMADDPAFAPVFTYLEKQAIPVMAHLGEPKNCWLPYNEMSMKGDLNYYQQNPQYHMFQYPEKPSYVQQIAARDYLLGRYPKLIFVGAHIGSLEWDLDEVAQRFDAYPNFSVDLSARMSYLQLHSFHDRAKVQSFLTKYQDRILYGSDVGIREINPDRKEEQQKGLLETWSSQWKFLATGDTVPSNQFTFKSAPNEMEGLRLTRTIVNKIFDGNTQRIFGC